MISCSLVTTLTPGGFIMSKVLLGACGDISFNGPLSGLVKEKGPDFAFENVIEYLKKPDILVGNMESVIVPPDVTPYKRGLHCPEYVAECLVRAGFDILDLANNHILDCGWKGLLYTQDVFRNLGIKTMGVGKDREEAHSMQVIEARGTKFGFLAYTDPFNWTLEGGGGRVAYFNLSEAIENVKKNKPLVDVLVVSLHAEMEFNPSPSMLKVDFCRKLAESGADIILCHHPHVPQGIELYGNSLIAYSLGNFAFDIDDYMMTAYPHTTRSHMLFIEIEDGKVTNWYREYLRINEKEGRPYRLDEEKRSEEEQYYSYLDSIVKDDNKLREMWYEHCRRYLKMYLEEALELGVDEFIRHFGFRVFYLLENQHWVFGIKELVDREWEKNRYNDFADVRPNSPFDVKA